MTEATGIKSLVETLQKRATRSPDCTAYTFLEDGAREGDRLTYRQLDEKARAITTYLQAQLAPGDRVLLVYLQGLEAIALMEAIDERGQRRGYPVEHFRFNSG